MTNLPPIPIPEANMASIMKTLHALRQYLLALGGQKVVGPTYHNPLLRHASTTPTQQERWTEDQRNTEVVKIVNPDDISQFMYVERTTQQVQACSVTSQKWVYNRAGAGDIGGSSAKGEDGGYGGGSPDL